MFLHRNDQKITTFNYFGPRILFVRPERTVGNNGLKSKIEKIRAKWPFFGRKSTNFKIYSKSF